MLPSSLIQAISMQKMKVHVDQDQSSPLTSEERGRGNGQTSDDSSSRTMKLHHKEDLELMDISISTAFDNEEIDEQVKHDLGGGHFDCPCEYPGEGLYEPEPKKGRKRRMPQSLLVKQELTGYTQQDLLYVDRKFILPSEHPACVSIEFICPGDIPRSSEWGCPQIPARNYKIYMHTRHVFSPADHPSCECTNDVVVTDQNSESGVAIGWNVSKAS